jgi:hypothetical protein
MSNLLNDIPSPAQLRAMLESWVVGDLLGPAGGPNEELTERNVRDRYLIWRRRPRLPPDEARAARKEETTKHTKDTKEERRRRAVWAE